MMASACSFQSTPRPGSQSPTVTGGTVVSTVSAGAAAREQPPSSKTPANNKSKTVRFIKPPERVEN